MRPMISETGRRTLAPETVAGLVVSTTQVVAVAGSCESTVPVESKWPNVSAEHVLPNVSGSRAGAACRAFAAATATRSATARIPDLWNCRTRRTVA